MIYKQSHGHIVEMVLLTECSPVSGYWITYSVFYELNRINVLRIIKRGIFFKSSPNNKKCLYNNIS